MTKQTHRDKGRRKPSPTRRKKVAKGVPPKVGRAALAVANGGLAQEVAAAAPDRTRQVVINNLARIKMLAVAGNVFCDSRQSERVLRLLRNRRDWGQPPPLVMVAVHRDIEGVMAARFQADQATGLARWATVRQQDHSETVGNAIKMFRMEFDPNADNFNAKRHILVLSRRGGKGPARFVTPFTGGGGTTCGKWTPVVERKPDGTPIKGFMKASLVVGFCPVECPFCYLQMGYTDGIDVALNWDELADELRDEWKGYPFPINFGETSGLIEYDEWLAGEDGTGSMAQFVIDACAANQVTPFFLTKIRYPRYVRFHGSVQVGVSAMPEPVRTWLAPYGSPTDELLDSLAWAVRSGARDPVVRMAVIWGQRQHYADLLRQCRDRLGATGWRLTADAMRFTPRTALTIAARYPEAATVLAEEIAPGSGRCLADLARDGVRDHAKKIRPPQDRQAEVFTWLREELNRLGCRDVMISPCKGDPEELLPLVKSGVLDAMPCACHHGTSSSGEALPPLQMPGVIVRPSAQRQEVGT